MENVQIIGTKELDEMEIEAINRIASRYYPKVERELKNEIKLVIQVKAYNKLGSQKKYSLNVKVLAPTRTFASSKNVDWNLEKVLHKSLDDIIKIIRHQLHTDDQNKGQWKSKARA
jgi:hypothetical protein